MIPFLKQVAEHYLAEESFGKTCFVFPNRRAVVFFRKYLGEAVAARGDKDPFILPPMYPVNDFLCKVSGKSVTDEVSLILRLYDIYKTLYKDPEPLDDFIFWGEVLLKDFDDMDKYLADAPALLQNVADFKSLEDTFSYLSERQRDAIEAFMSHFRDSEGRLTVKEEGKIPAKARFLRIWNILLPLYTRFREKLSSEGMAYEGMAYRELAEALRGGTPAVDLLSPVFPGVSKYVFVGLNALTTAEEQMMLKMRDAGIAEFVWDWCGPMIKDPANKSSVFMKGNLEKFPEAFPLDGQNLPFPEIHVVSVPSATGQVKLVPEILSQAAGDPVETALVLPDSGLLMPLLNSIPEEYPDVNVTMGFPMRGSALYNFIREIAAMQLRLRQKDGKWYFYHRQVRDLLSGPILSRIMTPPEKEAAGNVLRGAKYYIPEEDLSEGFLSRIFRPMVTDREDASGKTADELEVYLREIVSETGFRLASGGGEAVSMDLEFARRAVFVLNQLEGKSIPVKPVTWFSIMDKMMGTVSVPFRGEPLKGLQIMGPLETRALDFRNLVLFSVNEGTFPHHSTSPSFIPPELRKAFGLPSSEYQDAVLAYYFYRMIYRAEKVWLIYDSRTEGLHSGEESRFIKQLRYHFNVPLIREVATAQLSLRAADEVIPKTEEDVETIRGKWLSATALQKWLSCEAKFYYSFVKGLRSADEVSESMDAGITGTVFHDTMEDLYKGYGTVTPAILDGIIKDKARINAIIRSHILDELQTVEVSGRNLVVEEVIREYVMRTLRYDRKLLADSGSGGFEIIGLEQKMHYSYGGFTFYGIADRIDSYIPGEVRVVDYKTGKVTEDDIYITDENAGAVAEALFGDEDSKRPKISLQLFLYDALSRHSDNTREKLRGKTIKNSIYSVSHLFKEPLQDTPLSKAFSAEVSKALKEELDRMTDVSVPFRRTGDRDACSYCDFKNICGR